MDAAMRPMIFASIAVWVCSIVLMVVMLRARVSPATRRQFKQLAWAFTVFVLVIMAHQIYRASAGVILPGWFYACLLVGIFVPLQIALFVASMDKEALRKEQQQ